MLLRSGQMTPNVERRQRFRTKSYFKLSRRSHLSKIRATLATQTPVGVILADAGYGRDGGFRRGLTELTLGYAVRVEPTLSVWRPSEGSRGESGPPRLLAADGE